MEPHTHLKQAPLIHLKRAHTHLKQALIHPGLHIHLGPPTHLGPLTHRKRLLIHLKGAPTRLKRAATHLKRVPTRLKRVPTHPQEPILLLATLQQEDIHKLYW